METIPDARAGWQIPNRNTPWRKTINTVDSLTGVSTEWIQDLSIFRNNRVDTIPNTGLRRIITQTKPSLQFPFRPSSRVFSDRISYCIEETVEGICYHASVEDAVNLGTEFEFGILDSEAHLIYTAFYRPNTLTEVDFFQFHPQWTRFEEIDQSSVGQNLKNLVDLVKAHGEAVFVPQTRFSDNPQKEIKFARDLSLSNFTDKAINWTQDEKRKVADQTAVWLKQLLYRLLPNEKSDSPEMFTMFQWLYLEIMEGLPRDFETLTEEAQTISFRDTFKFEVSNSLAEWEHSLDDITEYNIVLTFGLPTDPVKMIFENMLVESSLSTTLQEGKTQHFDIYNLSVARGEEVMIAFQRLVRPQHRFEFRVPQEVNINAFRRIASASDSIDWEKAKEVAWGQYIKI